VTSAPVCSRWPAPARTLALAALVASVALVSAVRAARAAEFQRIVLPTGARLILKPVDTAELTAISICIRTEPDRTPLEDAAGELVARALFSSSLNRSRDRLAASIAEVGGSLETVRCADHVAITCVMLPTQVREAIYLLCEVLKNADFGGLDRVRQELIAEQRRGASGIAGGLDLLRRELQARPDLQDLPYVRVTHAAADAYFRSRYVPDRTAIAVVGQFNPEAVRTAFRDSLADFDRPAARQARAAPLYGHATNYPTRVLKQPGADAEAFVGMPTPPLGDPDFPAFVILKAILGEGHSSRLVQRIREARGIGYNVGAAWQPTLSDPLVAFLQTDARADGAPSGESTGTGSPAPPSRSPSPEAALRLISEQLDDLVANAPSEPELARARSVAVGRERLRHERVRDRAFLLSWYEAMGVGAEADSALPARLAAVSRDDVQRAAQEYLTTRASVLLVPDR